MNTKTKNIVYLILFLYYFELLFEYFKIYNFSLNLNFIIFFYLIFIFFTNTFLKINALILFLLFGFSIPVFDRILLIGSFVSYQKLIIINIKLLTILEVYIIVNEFFISIKDDAVFVLLTFIINIFLSYVFIKIYSFINISFYIVSLILFLLIIFYILINKNKKYV